MTDPNDTALAAKLRELLTADYLATVLDGATMEGPHRSNYTDMKLAAASLVDWLAQELSAQGVTVCDGTGVR